MSSFHYKTALIRRDDAGQLEAYKVSQEVDMGDGNVAEIVVRHLTHLDARRLCMEFNRKLEP